MRQSKDTFPGIAMARLFCHSRETKRERERERVSNSLRVLRESSSKDSQARQRPFLPFITTAEKVRRSDKSRKRGRFTGGKKVRS
jgi:hypothetical protein